jgi:ASC-1-like (ASCH) protein
MTMTTHELKIWPEYFEAVVDGRKTFELRKADRDFKIGDIILLKEYIPDYENPHYTGRKIRVKITYILDEAMTPMGTCLMSIILLKGGCQ